MNDDPTSDGERAYHGLTRAFIINEIFRRVEPEGRTLAEYLLYQFPEIDAFSGIQPNTPTSSRVRDIRDTLV